MDKLTSAGIYVVVHVTDAEGSAGLVHTMLVLHSLQHCFVLLHHLLKTGTIPNSLTEKHIEM